MDAVQGQAAETGQHYLQQLTGKHVRDSDAQSRGVEGQIIKCNKPLPKGQTTGDAARKMRLMVLLVEGLGIKTHLHKLIAN